jgi:hypothetical protein
MHTAHWLRRGALALLSVLVVGTIALAHHGWSAYDETKPLTVVGTIKSSTYANPHGTLSFEADGKTWDVVLAPTSRMQSRGLSEAMVAPGTKARIVGYAHKQQANEMRAERITIGGKTVELR